MGTLSVVRASVTRGVDTRRSARAGVGAFLFMALVVVACRSGPAPPKATGAAARPCPAGDPLAGVYHPDRLRVLGTCVRYVGTIRNLKHESDGDYHLYVIPDRGLGRCLDERSRGFGDLLLELLPGQPLPLPQPGQRVEFFGTWAYD